MIYETIPFWKYQQEDSPTMVSNLSKVLVPNFGTHFQRHIKWGCHLIHSKTWSKLGLDQAANVVYAVCLQLDFRIISMCNNLTNHNCSFVLNWVCGCFLHLSANSLYLSTGNVVMFICKTDMKQIYPISFMQNIQYSCWTALMPWLLLLLIH